jgi:pyroglutamyl-peptidase
MSDTSRTKILLTGFEPFPTQPVNASDVLVPQLAIAVRLAFPDVRVATEILATEWHAAPARIEQLLMEHEPDVALFFGISSKAKGFEIEMRGLNHRRESQDAAGVEMKKGVLWHGGPKALPSKLPISDIVRRLRARRIPVLVSRDAGGYLCNALLYHALLLAPHIRHLQRLGFVHVPSDLAIPGRRQTIVQRTCPLPWRDAVTGGVEIVGACLGRAVR